MLQAAWMESVKGIEGFRELSSDPKTRGFANEACDELRVYVRDLLTLDQPAITRALALHLDDEVIIWAMPVGVALDMRSRTWRSSTATIKHSTLIWGAAREVNESQSIGDGLGINADAGTGTNPPLAKADVQVANIAGVAPGFDASNEQSPCLNVHWL